MKALIFSVLLVVCSFEVAAAQSASESHAARAEAAAAEAELTRSERRELRRRQREAEREAEEAERASQAAAREADGVVCRKESVVGSHRRVEVCTTRAEREAMRNSARDVITDVTRPGGDFGVESQ